MIQNQKIKFAREVIFQEINALKKLSKSYNANFIKAIDLIQKCKLCLDQIVFALVQLLAFLLEQLHHLETEF